MGVQGHSQVHRKCKASLGSKRPHLKNKINFYPSRKVPKMRLFPNSLFLHSNVRVHCWQGEMENETRPIRCNFDPGAKRRERSDPEDVTFQNCFLTPN